LELLTKKIVPNDYFDTKAIMDDITQNLAEKAEVMEAQQLAIEIRQSELAKEIDNIVPNSEAFAAKRLEIRAQVKEKIKVDQAASDQCRNQNKK